MRRRITTLWIALPVSMLLAGGALAMRAQDSAAHARVELLSSASTIVAGKPFTVALSFDVDEQWHLYWKEPGESGMPPSVKWNLPEGFAAGELEHPAPKVLNTSAGKNYVHEGRFALLVTITPPATLKAGEHYDLAGEVKWLECDADACLPAKQNVSVRVLAGEAEIASHESDFAKWSAAIEAGRSYRPQ